MEKEFPSSYNPFGDILDREVLLWAWNENLFDNAEELERCRNQKINAFAGFIFPGFPKDKLEKVMKLLLCLFVLDDLLDVVPGRECLLYLDRLIPVKLPEPQGKSRISRVIPLINELIQNIGEAFFNQQAFKAWMDCWQNYVEGLRWEVKNRIEKRVPTLREYQIQRLHSSGVFLAIQLLRTGGIPESCDSLKLELDIARFICLSNDLDSLAKESDLEDFHNEVLLLQKYSQKDPVPWVINSLKALQRRIFFGAAKLEKASPLCKEWVKSLLNLVGGCIAWSSSTVRYQSHINGKTRLVI